jgi:hypothetical protein
MLTETYIRAVKWVGEQNEVSRPGGLVCHVLGNLLRALVVLLNANYRQRGRKDGGCRRVGNSGEVGELIGPGFVWVQKHVQHGEIVIRRGMTGPSKDVL